MAYTGALPGVPRDPTAVIGRRILAFIVDFVILWAVVIAVGAALAKTYSNAPTQACSILRDQGASVPTCIQSGSHVYVLDGGQTATMWFLGFLVWVGNYVLLQGATGATVGKFMLGLRTVDAQGQTCGMGRALVRSLLLVVDELFCTIVGLITVNVTHPHQRVGDLVAKTYVVATADVGVPFVAPMPVAVAAWGQPPPPAWGQPQQPAWGQPRQPAWGQPVAPVPPPYVPPPQDATTWGPPPAAPPPPPPAPVWDVPAQQQPAAPPPPPAWNMPPPPASPAAPEPAPAPPQQPAPPSWGTPPESAPPPPSAPPEQAAPPAQPPAGESWWDKAVEADGDDEPTQ